MRRDTRRTRCAGSDADRSRARGPARVRARTRWKHARRRGSCEGFISDRGPAATLLGVAPTFRDRARGCLLGGAIGDALGAAVEFLSWDAIVSRLGDGGVVDPLPAYGQRCPITDDTQMTLFTAEGLLRARAAGSDPVVAIHHAYLRWLHTQGGTSPHPDYEDALDGWLVRLPQLHASRAPGSTCLAGLQAARRGTI